MGGEGLIVARPLRPGMGPPGQRSRGSHTGASFPLQGGAPYTLTSHVGLLPPHV